MDSIAPFQLITHTEIGFDIQRMTLTHRVRTLPIDSHWAETTTQRRSKQRVENHLRAAERLGIGVESGRTAESEVIELVVIDIRCPSYECLSSRFQFIGSLDNDIVCLRGSNTPVIYIARSEERFACTHSLIIAVSPRDTTRNIVAHSCIQAHGFLCELSVRKFGRVPVALLARLAVFVYVVEIGENRQLNTRCEIETEHLFGIARVASRGQIEVGDAGFLVFLFELDIHHEVLFLHIAAHKLAFVGAFLIDLQVFDGVIRQIFDQSLVVSFEKILAVEQ